MTVGYFAGSFDMLNVVDLDLIAQARSQCSRLIVGVYTDAAVADAVGRPPVMPLSERMTLLYHLRDVDEVIVHGVPGGVPDSDILRFSVADEASPAAEPTVQLTPRRTSRSTLLREAVASVNNKAVA